MSTTPAKGWGKPKYGSTASVKTGKPKEGNNFIRILPPMHSLAESGKWAFYETTHWGFHGVNPTDPSQPFSRPIRCVKVEDRRTRMVSVECAACNEYDKREEEAKNMEAELRAGKAADDEIETQMASVNDWLKGHRPERRWYVNVLYKDGTFGNYKLNHKFHMAKLREFTEGPTSLQETEGVDPLELSQGVWFNIFRAGKGIKAVDTIKVEMEDVTPAGATRKQFQTLLAPLTDEQADQALRECVDLPTLGGITVTPEQMEELVSCSGEPEEIDRILGLDIKTAKGAGKPAATKAPAAAAKTVAKTDAITKATAAVRASTTAVVEAVKAAAAVEDPIAKRLAEIKAKKDAAAAEAKRVAEEAKNALEAEEKALLEQQKASEPGAETTGAGVNPADMDDEEFLRQFGGKNT